MRSFVLLTAAVLASIAIGIGALGLSGNDQSVLRIDAIDSTGHLLPASFAAVAQRVLELVSERDLTGLGLEVDPQGFPDPGVLEQNEVLSIPGASEKVAQMMEDTPAVAESGLGEYVWTGGLSTAFDFSKTRPRNETVKYDDLEVSFFLNGKSWMFLGVSVAPAGAGVVQVNDHMFLGSWYGHDRGLLVNPDGTFTITARSDWCNSSNPPPRPCDRFIGNEIVDGANATGRILRIDGMRATAVIGFTSSNQYFPRGQTTFVFHPATDAVTVRSWNFCGPSSPDSYCGA